MVDCQTKNKHETLSRAIRIHVQERFTIDSRSAEGENISGDGTLPRVGPAQVRHLRRVRQLK